MIKRRLDSFSNYFQLHSNSNPTRNFIDLLACGKCSLISSPIVSYEQLMNIETKYLRLYLLNRRVSILGFNEKKDLALLILNYNCVNEQNNPLNINISERVQRINSDSLNETSAQNSTSINSTQNENGTGNPIEPISNLSTNVEESNDPIPSRTTTTSSIQDTSALRKHASLSDLNSIDDIECLSIRQIKEMLAFNFVDYRDCVEKKDLVERLKRLYNSVSENKPNLNEQNNEIVNPAKENKDNSASNESIICKICMDSAIDCVLLNCGKYF